LALQPSVRTFPFYWSIFSPRRLDRARVFETFSLDRIDTSLSGSRCLY
jgi:hypothetical protein